jgi:Na+-driven multidrug efflux pump
MGGYYLTMHLLWSFALVPVLAISECCKVLIGNHAHRLDITKKLMQAALILVSLVMLLWGVLWFNKELCLRFFNQDKALLSFADQAFTLLFIPYILMAFNMTLDSLFYGLGKTKYLAYQAILTNGTVYLGAYICYLGGIWVPDFSSVLLLFGLGIFVDSLLTVYYVRKVWFRKG